MDTVSTVFEVHASVGLHGDGNEAKTCCECGKRTLSRQESRRCTASPLASSRCGERFSSSTIFDRIEAAARQTGAWGLALSTTVGRSGNALDVWIAKPLADFWGCPKVTIHPDGKKRRVIEPG